MKMTKLQAFLKFSGIRNGRHDPAFLEDSNGGIHVIDSYDNIPVEEDIRQVTEIFRNSIVRLAHLDFTAEGEFPQLLHLSYSKYGASYVPDDPSRLNSLTCFTNYERSWQELTQFKSLERLVLSEVTRIPEEVLELPNLKILQIEISSGLEEIEIPRWITDLPVTVLSINGIPHVEDRWWKKDQPDIPYWTFSNTSHQREKYDYIEYIETNHKWTSMRDFMDQQFPVPEGMERIGLRNYRFLQGRRNGSPAGPAAGPAK